MFSKHDFRQLQKFFYLRCTYSLNVLNMRSKPASRKVMK
jgi:hypothetical protein